MQPSQPGPRRKHLRRTLRGIPAERRTWYQAWLAAGSVPAPAVVTARAPQQQQENRSCTSGQ
jgi:hypothetical protein